MLTPRDCPTFLAELRALGENDAERAAELGVRSGMTVQRLRKRFPEAFRVFLSEPRLLRALLTDLERGSRVSKAPSARRRIARRPERNAA